MHHEVAFLGIVGCWYIHLAQLGVRRGSLRSARGEQGHGIRDVGLYIQSAYVW